MRCSILLRGRYASVEPLTLETIAARDRWYLANLVFYLIAALAIGSNLALRHAKRALVLETIRMIASPQKFLITDVCPMPQHLPVFVKQIRQAFQ